MNFVSKRGWFFSLSGVLIFIGLVFLVISPGLKPGIDFTGGSSITLDFADPVSQEDLRSELTYLGYSDALVQKLGDGTYFVRTKQLSTEEKNELISGIEVALSSSGYIDGSSVSVEFAGKVTLDELQIFMEDLGYPEAMIQKSDDNSFVIRIDELNNQQKNEFIEGMNSSIIASEEGGLSISFICLVPLDFVCPISVDLVSPVIARETVINAFWAVLAAAIGIFFYIWWAFRNVPSPFRYSVAAIVALVHDVLIVIGVFAVLGVIFGTEVNTMFLIALLTVIGYSVNDTIVVFDRLRENVLVYPNRNFASIVNLSISETVDRSLNTSLTLVFTLLALVLFGGSTIKTFLVVMLIGVVAGTYSSIAIASQILVSWDQQDLSKFFKKIRLPLISNTR